jgi:hypothetical protein
MNPAQPLRPDEHRPPGYRPNHRRHRSITVAAFAAAALLGGCGPDSPATPAAPTASVDTKASPTSAIPSVTPTANTGEAIAYANAETNYRAWVASWSAANARFDETKLDAKTVTPDLLAFAKGELAKFKPDAAKGLTGSFTQEIKSVVGTTYEPGVQVVLRVCAVTNSRFFRGGKDVTRSSANGPLAPLNTTARANDIQFTTGDGGASWVVSSFVFSPSEGSTC